MIVKLKPVINPEEKKQKNFNLMLLITFFTGVVLIAATYAWFYASLNVKVDFFRMKVSNESGLFISLDGVNYSSSVEISEDILITEMFKTYKNHTNQWAKNGLYSVSSVGIKNSNFYKFDMYGSSRLGYKNNDDSDKRYLNTRLITEGPSNASNVYIAFDMFLKNVSGSPFPDNLYIDKGTSVSYDNSIYNDADGTINSIRIGIVKINSAPKNTDPTIVQNLVCDNKCESIIYEPNSTLHSSNSVERAKKYGVHLEDGKYTPTYAVKAEGDFLELANGQMGSGVLLDEEHFAKQENHTNIKDPLFKIPNGFTKFRVYIWIEGQDVDSLETNSRGANVSINIDLIKDLAGYE